MRRAPAATIGFCPSSGGAWNAFVVRDWWRAIQKIERVCERLPGRPEPLLMLALVQLANNNRRQAYVAIQRAMSATAGDPELATLIASLGIRRKPVLPFLERSNPVNVTLGRLRHRFLGVKLPTSHV